MRKTLHLSQGTRDHMLSLLTAQQRMFLDSFLTRGKRTVFANVLAAGKAGDTEQAEEFAERWELLDYIDAGPQWRSESNLFCECGRQLRVQYIMENKETKEQKKFGLTHFEEHTGIPAQLALQIKKGMTSIDYELDEILMKIEEKWSLECEGIELPEDMAVPADIQQHIEHGIPLLNRQIVRLRMLIAKTEAEKQEKQLAELKAMETQREIAWQSGLADRKERLGNSSWWAEVQGNTDLEPELQLGVILSIQDLNKEMILASEVAECLVKRYGAPQDTYPTGKYKIFPYVCLFLGYLTSRRKLQLAEKKVNTDRLYKVVDPFLLKGADS